LRTTPSARTRAADSEASKFGGSRGAESKSRSRNQRGARSAAAGEPAESGRSRRAKGSGKSGEAGSGGRWRTRATETGEVRRLRPSMAADYHAWVFRFEMWARGEGLWEYYEGTQIRPGLQLSRTLQRGWRRPTIEQRGIGPTCGRLWRLCRRSEPDDIVKILREYAPRVPPGAAPGTLREPARTANAWQRLEGFYRQKQFNNVLILESQLMSLQMQPEETVSQYWARADDLRRRLETAGAVSGLASGWPES